MQITISLVMALGVLLIPSSSISQTHPESKIKPHLYAVTKDGRTSYVFGSYHRSIALSSFPDYFFNKFRSSRVIAKEVLSDAPSNWQAPPDRELPSPEAQAALRERGIPEYLFKSSFICSYYYGWENSADRYLDGALEDLARLEQKELRGLDSEEHRRLGDEAHTADLLRCDIENATKYLKVAELVRSDLESLQQYYLGDLSLINGCTDLCAERTLDWVGRLEAMFAAEGGAFAIVGVAHLVGKQGLLHLLRTRGYTVTLVRD